MAAPPPGSLFREAALAELNSPDQLDQALVVTNPRRWLGLAAAGAVIAAGLLWAVFGRIETRIEAAGALVADPAPGALTAVLYVPPAELALVRPGQPVRLSPLGLAVTEHGYLEGVVESLDTLPATDAARTARLGNEALARHLGAPGLTYEVRVRLLTGPDGAPRRTLPRALETPLGPGRLCAAQILIRSERPLNLVLPRPAR
jgi:hypothetical protein